MDLHTLNTAETTKESAAEFVKGIETVGGFDLVSDFGQEEIRRREKETREKFQKGTVYFEESSEQRISYF